MDRSNDLLESLTKTSTEGAELATSFLLAYGVGIAGDLASAQEVAYQGPANDVGNQEGANLHAGEWQVPSGLVETALRIKYRHLHKGKTARGAYFRALTKMTDGHVKAFAIHMGRMISRGGGYSLGQVTIQDAAAGVLRFNVQSETPNVVRGMILTASINDGSQNIHTLLPNNVNFERAYVQEVDYDAGTIVVSDTSLSGAPGVPASWGVDTNQRFIFALGQFRPLLGFPGVTAGIIQTLDEWITPAKANDTYNGVPRNVHSALSGVRVPLVGGVQNMPLEQRLAYACTYGQTYYGWDTAPKAWVHGERWFEMFRSLQAQGSAQVIKENRKFAVATCLGMMEVGVDPNRPEDFGLLLGADGEQPTILYDDGFPNVVPSGGLKMLAYTSSNDLEFRCASMCKLIVRQPWLHGRVPFN